MDIRGSPFKERAFYFANFLKITEDLMKSTEFMDIAAVNATHSPVVMPTFILPMSLLQQHGIDSGGGAEVCENAARRRSAPARGAVWAPLWTRLWLAFADR